MGDGYTLKASTRRRVVGKLNKFVVQRYDRELESRRLKGTLGRRNVDGSFTFEVTGKPKFMFVTTRRGTIVEALNEKVARQAQLPVKLEKSDDLKYWVIKETDQENIAAWAGNTTPGYNLPDHSHEPGFMFDPVSMRRMTWAQVYLSGSGLLVAVNRFAYVYGGEIHVYAGGSFDLTPFLPATTGTWAWIVVLFDPATATFDAVTGSENVGTSYNVELLDGIAIPAGQWTLAAVHLAEDATSIPYDNYIYDLRQLWAADGASLAGGGEEALYLALAGL